MFPFNLPGPMFLVAYASIGAALLCGFWYLVRSGEEPQASNRLDDLTSDPYRIGYLRGAEDETVRLAVVNLIDRGLLANTGATLKQTGNAAAEMLRRPLDRAILKRCERETSYTDLAADRGVTAACKAYGMELSNAGLVRGGQHQNRALLAFVVVIGLLGGGALARILQALSHGRGNFLFLVILAAASCWIAWSIFANRKTFAGIDKLKSLQTLMGRLKSRAGSLEGGGATNEALLLAAVFGLEVLPGGSFPFIDQLFPKPRPSDTSSSSWGSDSSSGSSCGSSSSCGGGGGSGCGGCGGGGD